MILSPNIRLYLSSFEYHGSPNRFITKRRESKSLSVFFPSPSSFMSNECDSNTKCNAMHIDLYQYDWQVNKNLEKRLHP